MIVDVQHLFESQRSQDRLIKTWLRDLTDRGAAIQKLGGHPNPGYIVTMGGQEARVRMPSYYGDPLIYEMKGDGTPEFHETLESLVVRAADLVEESPFASPVRIVGQTLEIYDNLAEPLNVILSGDGIYCFLDTAHSSPQVLTGMALFCGCRNPLVDERSWKLHLLYKTGVFRMGLDWEDRGTYEMLDIRSLIEKSPEFYLGIYHDYINQKISQGYIYLGNGVFL